MEFMHPAPLIHARVIADGTASILAHLLTGLCLQGGRKVAKKARPHEGAGPKVFPGSDLLSHPVTRAVPSAQEGLTSVFGMETGVSPPLWPPENSLCSPFLKGGNRIWLQSPFESGNKGLWSSLTTD